MVADTTDPLLDEDEPEPSLDMPGDTGGLARPSLPSDDTSGMEQTDQPSLDELNLNVNEIDGSVIRRSDTQTAWRRLNQGDSIQQGDELIVADGGTVTLTVPGVSAIKLEPGSMITVSKLKQTLRRKGILTDDKRVVNNIELEMDQGSLKSKVRDNTEQANDIKLKTPDAVAGIRGTAFECETGGRGNRGGGTSCSVLNGEVRFASRADTSRFRTLGPGERSEIREENQQPSEPEEMSDKQKQDLEEFEEEVNPLLVDEIQLDGIEIDGADVPRSGQGQFRQQINYEEQRSIEIAVNLSIPDEDTSVPRVVLQRQGEERSIANRDDWVFTISPEVPDEGQRQVLNYTVYWEGDQGQRSRSFPLQIRLVHASSHGVLPGGLNEGDVPVTVEEIGGQNARQIRFPYRLTSQDLASLRIGEQSDTSIVSEDGVVIRGTVDTDSTVEGVGYRFENGAPWRRASDGAEWSLVVPLDTIRERGSVNLELIAWTTDGVEGTIERLGPFEFESVNTAFPVDYETDPGIEASITSVAGTPVTNLPVTISNTQLSDQTLSISGQVSADTEVVGLAVRVNGGPWSTLEGNLSTWSIEIPVGTSSTQYTLDLMAWTAGGTISPLTDLGPINYEYVPPAVPDNYESGNVPVELSTVEGNGVSNLEFPYYFYQGDISGGITYRGTASGDDTIEGVAYSVDGGNTWKRAEGGADWSFTLPAESTTTYDQVQVRAWTVAGIIGDPVSLNTIVYDNRKFATVFRDIFTSRWTPFENGRIDQFLNPFSTADFQFTDDVSGIQRDYSQFERLSQNFVDGVRNLRVFHDINRVLASESGGEMTVNLEFRGTADDPDRPFLVTGTDVEFQLNRAANGQFEINSLSGLPAIMYLFNKKTLRIDDLGSIYVQTLETVPNQNADVIYQAITPDLTVNRISIGGHVSRGGIQSVNSGGFSSVNEIPRVNNGYDTASVIQEGELYAVNIRSQRDGPATALIEVVDIRSSFVEVRMISAQAFPGEPDRAITRYRGVVPFDQ